jgi:hypothetical protein
MFLNSGFKFNRFGEELDSTSSSGVSELRLEEKLSELRVSNTLEIHEKIKQLQKEFQNVAHSKFEEVKKELIERANKQVAFEKHYISVKKKRIVNAKRAIDKTDVVIKEQLDEVNTKIDGVLKGLEVTDDCIQIKNGRKICGISRSNSAYDAINGVELVEVYNRLHAIETKLGLVPPTLHL